jgi:hypothetical protein
VEFLLLFQFSDFFFFHFEDFFKDAVFVEFTFDRVNSEPESLILLFEILFLVFVDVKGLIDLKKVTLFGLKLLAEFDNFLFLFLEIILKLSDGVFAGLELVLELFVDEELKFELTVESDEFLLKLLDFRR